MRDICSYRCIMSYRFCLEFQRLWYNVLYVFTLNYVRYRNRSYAHTEYTYLLINKEISVVQC